MTPGPEGTYDEFSMFAENASEAGLEWKGPPTVRRQSTEVAPGRRLSALVWGDPPPCLSSCTAEGRTPTPGTQWPSPSTVPCSPSTCRATAIRTGRRTPRPSTRRPWPMTWLTSSDVLAPDAAAVIGMSLGGITAIALATRHPELVRRLVLVDITPGVNREKSSDIAAFLAGPESFASFDEILQRTIEFNPTRSVSSLRRGVLHNAVQREDGSWTWRHQLGRPARSSGLHVDQVDFAAQWDDLEQHRRARPSGPGQPLSGRRRRRRGRVPPPPAPRHAWWWSSDAGHSIQGDRPVELARIIDGFVAPAPA